VFIIFIIDERNTGLVASDLKKNCFFVKKYFTMKLLCFYCNEFSYTPQIKTLPDYPDFTEGKSFNNLILAFIQAEEGGSYGDIMGYDFKRTEDGTPIIAANGMPIRSDEQIALGNGQYKFTGGLTNTISYKGLKFRALIQSKTGADILSMTNQRLYQYGTHIGTLEGREGWAQSENEREDAGVPIEDWTATGGYLAEGVIQDGVDTEGNPVYKANDVYVDPRDYWGNVANGHITQPFVYDASYVKLREASISYTLSDKAINSVKYIDALTFSVIGRNLWLIYSDVPNIDPESTYSITNGQGYEYGSLPQRRSFGFNINVKF